MKRILTFLASPLLWMLVGAGAAALFWLLHRRQKVIRQTRLLGTRLRDIGELAVEEARITLVHCTREPRRITLRLPQMRILSSAIDYESMQVYDEKTGVFARTKLEWHRESMLHLCREAEDEAVGA